MAKLSDREKWSQQTGLPKEQYPGSKKSSSKSSSSKTPDYSSFMVDTKPIEKAYSTAADTYLTELSALKPRYEQLYQQLEAQKVLQAEKDTALSGEEATLQKQNIAKRGIAVTDDNQFFTGERTKLQANQNVRDRETALGFAGKRLEIGGAESADTREINTAIANIGLSKANKIADIVDRNKTTLYNLEKDAKAKEQWEKTFAYTQSKDAADRALEMYKFNKSSADGSSVGTSLAGAQEALLASRGKDTKVDPNVYLAERSKYLKSVKGATVTQFDQQFGNLLSSSEQVNLGVKSSTEATPKTQSAEAIKQSETAASGLRALANVEKMATLGNRLQATLPGQLGAGEYVNNINEVIDAISRLRTGAALTEAEEKFYRKQVPELTDSAETIKSKINNLKNFFNGIAERNGVSNDPLGLGI